VGLNAVDESIVRLLKWFPLIESFIQPVKKILSGFAA